MEERLIKGRTNVLALEKGFDNTKRHLVDYTREYVDARGEGTGEYYSEIKWVVGYVHPTQSLLQKWLRETHQFFVGVSLDVNGKYYWYLLNNTNGKIVRNSTFVKDFEHLKTYEEALELGLIDALKLIK